ncbi:SulP family inorganic anion transporter [bacterium]|nr:SulP family inorganic anion transporter [bacterium]
MLPGALGDASLAGLPPEAGIYACLFSGLIFWSLCSSKHTSITVTSAISLLIGATLGGKVGGNPHHYNSLASCTALLTALIAFVAWMARAGSMVSFVSETVVMGFKTGVALHLISTQLPKLCSVPGHHGDFWQRAANFASHAHQTHPLSLMLGLTALAGILLGKRFLPEKPVALFIIVTSIAAGNWVDYQSYGVRLVGYMPRGIPWFSLPEVRWHEVQELVPLALACFLLGAVETSAIGRMFAEKHGYRLNSSQEFLALSGANLAAGLGRGFPVSGGMSQSVVNESVGAHTPVSGLVAAVVLALVAWSFSDLLHNLPQPVLAAVVIAAVTGLIHGGELIRLWRLHREEFFIAVAALVGVLGVGLLQGVLIGAIISLGIFLRRSYAAHVAFLVIIPGSRRYSDIDRHHDNEPIPGILACRVEAAILYFNSEHILDSVLNRVDASTGVQLVICDLSNSADLDVGGCRMLLTLYAELLRRGIQLRLVEARSHVREMLRIEGVEDKVGEVDRFTTLDDVIESYQESVNALSKLSQGLEQAAVKSSDFG